MWSVVAGWLEPEVGVVGRRGVCEDNNIHIFTPTLTLITQQGCSDAPPCVFRVVQAGSPQRPALVSEAGECERSGGTC